MSSIKWTLALALAPLFGVAFARVDGSVEPDPVEKGFAIAKEAERRDAGFGDFSANVEMILNNKQGTASTREFSINVLEVNGDGDKSLLVFDRPRDVDGTALLTFSHKADNDDQWIFLPALKRVKRISSTNRSGPFVGSEFAYEDMILPEAEKFAWRWVKDENLNDIATHVVERAPNYKNSGYSRQLVWYDAETFCMKKIEYYDRKGELMKVLSINGYDLYKEQFWRAREMLMVNVQTGKSTQLRWSQYQFGNGFSDKDFQLARLQRLH